MTAETTTCSDAVASFHNKGYVVLDSIFADLELDGLRDVALSNFEEIKSIIKEKGLHFGVGIKEGYDEIVQRHIGRYEVPYKMKNVFRGISEHPGLLEIVHAILGPDIIISNESLLVSDAGAGVSEYLPCHVLNVFIPLIDITDAEGPTEFRPCSQRLTLDLKRMYLRAFMKKELLPTEKPHLKKGSCLLFDYRVLHRGTANTTQHYRPVYVVTFAKSWYRDTLNFPMRSVFSTGRELFVDTADSSIANGANPKEDKGIAADVAI